jgi:hypothetical protein
MEPSRGKSICIPFKSEDHYAICVADPEGFRQYLLDLHSRHPELLPAGFEHGFVFHDKSWSIKQRVLTRRLRLIATGQLYQVRPSFLMPYLTARTEMVERGLYLRQWGVPFDALAYSIRTRCDVLVSRRGGLGPPLPGRDPHQMPREAARTSPRRREAHRVGGTQALPVDHRGRRLPTGSEPSAYSRGHGSR